MQTNGRGPIIWTFGVPVVHYLVQFNVNEHAITMIDVLVPGIAARGAYPMAATGAPGVGLHRFVLIITKIGLIPGTPP
jgi:hypothetical protein